MKNPSEATFAQICVAECEGEGCAQFLARSLADPLAARCRLASVRFAGGHGEPYVDFRFPTDGPWSEIIRARLGGDCSVIAATLLRSREPPPRHSYAKWMELLEFMRTCGGVEALQVRRLAQEFLLVGAHGQRYRLELGDFHGLTL